MEYPVFLLIICLGALLAALLVKPAKSLADSLLPGLDEVLYSVSAAPLLMMRVEDYTIISTNKACGDLCGQARLIGRPLEDIFAEGKAVVECVKKQVAEFERNHARGYGQELPAALIGPGEAGEMGARQKSPAKETYSVLVPNGPLPLARVELIYMSKADSGIAVIQLTIQKAAESAINSDSFLRAAFDASQHPFFLKDHEGRFVAFNEYYHRTFGSMSDNLIGKTGSELVPADQAERALREDQEVIRRGVARSAELWVTCSDGRKALFSTTKSPIRNASGEIIGLLGEGYDITGRRLEQEAMMREKSLLRAVIDAIPDLVFFKDANCRYLGCNQSMENLLGICEEDIIGKTDADLLPPELAASRSLSDQNAMRQGGRVVGEELISTPGGTFVYESVKTPYFAPDGKTIGIVCVSRDITTRKEVEKATKAAQMAADESNRAKSEFLANMSHEIRTPMNAIIGLAYLVLKTDLSPKQQDYVGKIHNAGKALLGIVNDILDFSKIEANQMQMEEINFNLDDIFENLSSMLGQKSVEKGLELIFDIDSDVPHSLVGDPLRLGQVLNNLVSNSIKFTESGEIKVSCRLLEKNKAAVKLAFVVSDTGIGMTPEQQKVIFKAFGQADASTTRQYGGTGLGLVITKRLLQMMDGNIEVRSEYKRGTVITCATTFKIPPEAPDALEQMDLYGGDGLPDNAGVLVVDDNKTTCDSLESLLRNISMRPKSVNNTEAAFAELVNARRREPGQEYRAVIIDVGMDGMSGLEFISQIRNNENIAFQPAIILSLGAGMEDLQSKARQDGANAFLPKPFTRRQLFDALCLSFRGQSWSAQRRNKFEKAQVTGKVKPAFSGEDILLVEDNLINQQVATELIQELNLAVTVCNNGQEALEMLADSGNAFKLVLMDLQMPVMDGYKATVIIRSQERFKNIPIIAMTAHAMAEEREHCLALGMNDHIAKPIEVEKLYAALRKWIPEDKPAPKRDADDNTTQDYSGPEDFTEAYPQTRARDNAPGTELKMGPDMRPAERPAARPSERWAAHRAADAAKPHSQSRLGNLSGFDITGALARLGGNEGLFQRLLCQFKKHHSQAGKELRQALDDGRREEARRIAHTIKGLAGNIGSNNLFQTAETLEKECARYNSADKNALPGASLEEALVDFATELDMCLQRITASSICEADEAEQAAARTQGKTPEQLKPLLDKLTVLINENDAEAAFLLESLRNDLSTPAPEEYKAVRTALEIFDFDKAQSAMEVLCKKIESS